MRSLSSLSRRARDGERESAFMFVRSVCFRMCMPCLTVSTARFSQERVCSASATDAVRLRSTRTNPLWQVSGLTAHRRSISILCAKPARPFPSSVVPISDALVLPSARRPKAEREKRVRRHSMAQVKRARRRDAKKAIAGKKESFALLASLDFAWPAASARAAVFFR